MDLNCSRDFDKVVGEIGGDQDGKHEKKDSLSEQLQSAIGGLQGQTTHQARLTPDTYDPTVAVFW